MTSIISIASSPRAPRRITLLAAIALLSLGTHAAATHAATLAYWRFEAGPVDTDVIHNAATGVYAADIPDSSGNGNDLSVWSTGSFAGFAYRGNVPGATVPLTGAPNTLSIKNTGGFPAGFTGPGAMRSIEPAAFTVEASFKVENGGFRTFVGRDSQGAATSDANLAALYLQAIPGNAVAFKFVDKAGFFHEAISAPNAIQGFDFPTDPNGDNAPWYNIAGVSNGSTLSLYLRNATAGGAYQLVAQTDMTLSGSSNTTLTSGLGSGGDWTAGDWTVGRGMYAGGHGDRAWGYLDEVRISDAALSPSQFLFAIPEPTSGALLLVAVFMTLRCRR